MNSLFDTKPKPQYPSGYPALFNKLWNAYGKKGAKKASVAQWEKLTRGMPLETKQSWRDWIIERATLYRTLVPPEQFQFTKDLERWLKDGVYEFDAKEVRQRWGLQAVDNSDKAYAKCRAQEEALKRKLAHEEAHPLILSTAESDNYAAKYLAKYGYKPKRNGKVFLGFVQYCRGKETTDGK